MTTPTYRLFALASRMSRPSPGVLHVTIASNSRSKNGRWRRASRSSTLSPAASGSAAPLAAATRTAAANASGAPPGRDFPGGDVVEAAGVEPEQLCVADDRVERDRIDAVRMRDDRLEQRSHLE